MGKWIRIERQMAQLGKQQVFEGPGTALGERNFRKKLPTTRKYMKSIDKNGKQQKKTKKYEKNKKSRKSGAYMFNGSAPP